MHISTSSRIRTPTSNRAAVQNLYLEAYISIFSFAPGFLPEQRQPVKTVNNEIDKTLFFSITEKQKDLRLDTFLASHIHDLTRNRIQELIKKGFARVNDCSPKMSYRLKPGDQVHFAIPPVRPVRLEPEWVDFALLHEDSAIIVLNKPPGLVIHPAPGHQTGTLAHGLLQHSPHLSGLGGTTRPGIVHRLDKDTSGIMVVAKNDRAHAHLAKQFKDGRVKKRYLALVHGIVRGTEGEIDLPIGRHPIRRKEMSVRPAGGRRALTLWRKLEEYAEGFTLLSAAPKTGRTHQIRVHLSYMGHPIVGDSVYGSRRNRRRPHLPKARSVLPKIERQMLHSETLGFLHPDTGNYCEYKAPIPDDMGRVLEALKSGDFHGQREEKT